MPHPSAVKAGKRPTRLRPVGAPRTTAAPVTTDQVIDGGASKKKKKKKGKSMTNVSIEATVQHIMDEGEDDMPSLEPYKTPPSFAHTRTRLSPDLESVHLSTTASLTSLSTAARQGLDNLSANANGTPVAELLAELCRKVGVEGMDEEMRKNLDALPSVLRLMKTMGNDSEKATGLLELLQSSGLDGEFATAQGTIKNGTATLDKNTFSERALVQILQHFASSKKSASDVSDAKAAALRTGIVVDTSHGLSSDEEVFEDEIFSEDEVGERNDGDRYAHTDGTNVYASRWDGTIEAVYCEVEDAAPPGAYPDMAVDPRRRDRAQQGQTKKSSRRPEEVTKPRVTVPTSPTSKGQTQSTAMAPNRNAPPPSARAAGKQPMAYAPAAPTATTTPTNTAPPPRSARAAAKAPAPPQSYTNHSHPHHNPSPPVSNASVSQKHRPPGSSGQGGSNGKVNSKIWNTNTAEERERIKEFWLGLSEKDRRQLVEVEKETVLKRMKEQQKHSCTCAVCGRKRNAIEEELEVLYDAYYEELEQYANYQQRYASSGGTLPPPPGPGPFPGSVELDKDGFPVGTGKPHTHSHPPSARVKSNALTNGPKKGVVPESEFDEEEQDADDYEEDDYDEDEDEEDEDDEDDVDAEDDVEIRSRSRTLARGRNRGVNGTKANGRDSLFNFGSSLTVAGPGNILTVADDLLKNDGQKFLEMMEQLAERRMQREEESARYVEEDSEEDEEDEGEDDDEGDEDEEDEDEEDEEEVMTEEQKIAEGKRMFSIFAARMFEQRVLQAYREKVAQERQRQLLQELEEEEQVKNQREAKKAKENQKKKDKRRQQRMAKEEERVAKAKEKAAEEAAEKEKQRKLEEDQRKKRDEERAKREVARKAAEEERARREEERRKRLAEEKEQQAERERKRKEKEERLRAERKEREEKERKAREEREAKLAAERAEKAKKEQQEKEEREKRLAKEKEEKEKAEREAKERQAREQQQSRITAAAKSRPPSSPRVNSSTSGSRQQQQQQNVAPKKILSKPSTQPSTPTAPTPIPAAPAQPVRQPSRPGVPSPQQVQPSQQATTSPTTPANVAPSTPTFAQGAFSGMSQPLVSPPRAPFPPPVGVPGYGPFLPQMPAQLAPSPMSRFGTGAPFEPGFGRTVGPIGPPSKGLTGSLQSPIMQSGTVIPNRRMSGAVDPGPIMRPTTIAPIARPNGVNGGDSSGSAPASGGASPSHLSESPKGVLGSSALAADDDEVVTTPVSRRAASGPVGPPGPIGPPGQGWQSPRGSMAVATPWNPTAPGQGFSPSRAPGVNGGATMPAYGGGWPSTIAVNAASGVLNDWQGPPGQPYYGTPPFIHQNHSAATPPPHSTSN